MGGRAPAQIAASLGGWGWGHNPATPRHPRAQGPPPAPRSGFRGLQRGRPRPPGGSAPPANSAGSGAAPPHRGTRAPSSPLVTLKQATGRGDGENIKWLQRCSRLQKHEAAPEATRGEPPHRPWRGSRDAPGRWRPSPALRPRPSLRSALFPEPCQAEPARRGAPPPAEQRGRSRLRPPAPRPGPAVRPSSRGAEQSKGMGNRSDAGGTRHPARRLAAPPRHQVPVKRPPPSPWPRRRCRMK